MRLVLAGLCVLVIMLAGCSSGPSPMIAAETASVLAPYLAKVDAELVTAQREAGAALTERAVEVMVRQIAVIIKVLDSARAYLAPVLATVGPAAPTTDCPEQAAEALAKVSKTSFAAIDRAAEEQAAKARWAETRSRFWYILFIGAIATAVCLTFVATRALAGYPAIVAVGSAGVLLFASSLRTVVADLAASAWGLIPVVLILGAVGGTCWYLWRRFVRERKTLGAVISGVEKLDDGAKVVVKEAATEARVEPYLNASLVKRGLSKGTT